MQKPMIRYMVAAVLIAAAAIGGFFVFDAHRRAAAIEATAREVNSHVERMHSAAGAFAAAQQAYVAPGQPQQPWFERSAARLQQIAQDEAAIRPLLQSQDARQALDELNEQFKSIVLIDNKVREYLQQGESLLAADLIFSEGRDSIGLAVNTLAAVDSSEQQVATTIRAGLERHQLGSLAAIGVIWLAGLVLLTPSLRSAHRATPAEKLTLLDRTPADAGSHVPDSPVLSPQPDLPAVAELCGALARAVDANALRDALARAAALLDAPGIVVWLGAGEELFPALAYGYDERVVARLGCIPRDAPNATAAAWRSAQLRTVPADAASPGAIAVPMSSVSGCIGVFTAELRAEREQDVMTRAVASVIAAQLAAILPTWPAPSTQPLAASGS